MEDVVALGKSDVWIVLGCVEIKSIKADGTLRFGGILSKMTFTKAIDVLSAKASIKVEKNEDAEPLVEGITSSKAP